MQAQVQAVSCRSLSLPLARAPQASLRSRRSSHRVYAAVQSTVEVQETGIASLQGTSRKQNEDRFAVSLDGSVSLGYAAVFDGHGGYACAEWLSNNLLAYVEKFWESSPSPEGAIDAAFLAADRKILTPKSGLFGMMGERGIGGSKCGATGAVVLLYKGANGKRMLMSANAGDARVLLGRGATAVQLSEDHVPDSEEERLRIEAQNPNPNMPLVRYVGGTWRVGGLLALSRAFGDAYLKGTGQFEGIQAGGDGYSSGFGVIAEPHVETVELTDEDKWVIVSSDGLFANMERGGGGGISNEEAISMCNKMAGKSCNEISQTLAEAAVEAGSTDDVTVVVLRLK